MSLGVISNETAERLSGLTARRLRQLAAEGKVPQPTDRGEWDAEELLSALIAYYRKAAERLTDGLRGEEIRRATADADLAEMKRDQLRGKLWPRDDVLSVWSEQLAFVRDAIMAADIPRADKGAILATLREPDPQTYGTAGDSRNDQERSADTAADRV